MSAKQLPITKSNPFNVPSPEYRKAFQQVTMEFLATHNKITAEDRRGLEVRATVRVNLDARQRKLGRRISDNQAEFERGLFI